MRRRRRRDAGQHWIPLPWEGLQGTDSFFPWQVGDQR